MTSVAIITDAARFKHVWTSERIHSSRILKNYSEQRMVFEIEPVNWERYIDPLSTFIERKANKIAPMDAITETLADNEIGHVSKMYLSE